MTRNFGYVAYCAIKVESNDRDPCSKIVSKFHERDRTSFPRRRESANFSLCNMDGQSILRNVHHEVLYIGVTSDLFTRIPEHITKVYPNSFTAKYNCNKLVYYETFGRIEDAIAREKQLKKWNRS